MMKTVKTKEEKREFNIEHKKQQNQAKRPAIMRLCTYKLHNSSWSRPLYASPRPGGYRGFRSRAWSTCCPVVSGEFQQLHLLAKIIWKSQV
jgi:hypothetical protein